MSATSTAVSPTARGAAELRTLLLPHTASALDLPAGWILVDDAAVITVVGPEADLQIAFVAIEAMGSAEATAAAAWHMADPAFAAVVSRQTEQPSADGWDLASEIYYRLPSAEGRIAMALVRTLDAHAYVNLITGTMAAFGRRGAQVAELVDAWKPQGLSPTTLADRPAAVWSARHREEIDRFIRDAMTELRIPGVAIAIVQDGKLVCAEGFGVRSIDDPQPVTPDTRFMIGSTTKPLTTLLMARLVDQGRFAWTTPVTEVLPDFALGDAQMTAQLQMRHTVAACTGMPRRDVELAIRYRGVSPEQRLAEMQAMQPTTGFGEVFQYSNHLIAAGGYAAARSFAPHGTLASAYTCAMKQLVFDPLAMTSTTLSAPEEGTANAAHPNGIDFEGNAAPIDAGMERMVDAIAPAGAVWSTVRDMAAYLQFELDGGVDRTGTRLLSRELLESRRQGGIRIDGKTSYGLGLALEEVQGLDVCGHGGNTCGFTSDMYFLPARNIGVVVLANMRGANAFVAALRQKLLELIFDAPYLSAQMIAAASSAMHATTARLHERVKTDADAVAWLDAIAGTRFHCDALGDARISKRDGHYAIAFDAWESTLGSEIEPDGNRFAVLTSPPWIGLKLLVAHDGNTLRLADGQEQYTFTREH